MEDNRSINVDYIAVIRQDGNLVKYEQIDIPKPEGLLSDLEGILNDPDEISVIYIMAIIRMPMLYGMYHSLRSIIKMSIMVLSGSLKPE